MIPPRKRMLASLVILLLARLLKDTNQLSWKTGSPSKEMEMDMLLGPVHFHHILQANSNSTLPMTLIRSLHEGVNLQRHFR